MKESANVYAVMGHLLFNINGAGTFATANGFRRTCSVKLAMVQQQYFTAFENISYCVSKSVGFFFYFCTFYYLMLSHKYTYQV